MRTGFWRGKRVFVTGHTGFKGGWLSLWLQELGAEVCGYALTAPTRPALFEVASVGRGMRSNIGDIRDAIQLASALREFRPEIIFHMAAQPLVRLSYAEPVATYATNVMGTIHLLEAAGACDSVRAVVNITTDKCYENREWLWGYREDEPLGGHDPYSSSKACAELVTSAYRRSFFAQRGLALASVRAGNVIGGGDWALDRLVPDILRAFAAGEEVVIRNPGATRPWQHVLEPLAGYLTLGQALHEHGAKFAEAWNFGPRDTDVRPVRWIVDELTRLWGASARSRHESSAKNPHEAGLLKLDCSKALARLDWAPRWDLSETLRRIVAWHRAWIVGADMRAHSVQEIRDYQDAAAG